MNLPIAIFALALALAASTFADSVVVSPSERLEFFSNRPKYLLGEDVRLTFSVINTGTTPMSICIMGDWGRGQNPDFILRTRLSNGGNVPELFQAISIEMMIRPVQIAAGGRYDLPIDLSAYSWIDQPGDYVVTIESRDTALFNGLVKAKPLSCRLTFEQPTPEKAQSLVDAATHNADVAGALRPMHEEFYLPLLLKLRSRLPADQLHPALEESFLPETTKSLIQIAADSEGDECEWALQTILNRMNDSTEMWNTIRSWLAKNRPTAPPPWQASMATSLRAVAIKHLSDASDGVVTEAAVTLGEIADTEDAPAIVAATTSVIDREISSNPPANAFLPRIFANACGHLVRQGYRPPKTPTTFGEIITYLEAIQNDPAFRPANSENKCVGWTQSRSRTIRSLVLEVQPTPLGAEMAACLPVLLTDSDSNVVEAACVRLQKQLVPGTLPVLLKLLKTLHYQPSYDAFEAAVEQGGRLPALEAAVDQIEEGHGLEKLCNVLENGDRIYVERSRKLDDVSALRLRWHAWIDQHRDELAAGKKFDRNDRAFAGQLFPSQMQFHFSDDSLWPRYDDGTSNITKP